MTSLEDIVLGCVYFDDKKNYIDLAELADKYFSNKPLFKKVFDYRKNNLPYDMIVALQYFTGAEIQQLEEAVGKMGHIDRYEYYWNELKKQKIEAELLQQITDKKIDPALIQKYMATVNSAVSSKQLYDFEGDLHDYLARFDEKASGKFEKYSLNMEGFDETLGYIRPKRYYTIGASPGVGKTNLMLKMMMHLMAQDIPCLFFTAEMDYDALVDRMGAMNSGLRLFDVLNAHLKPEQIKEYADALQKHVYAKKSYIFETPRFNVAKIKDLVDKTKAKFIFVDYLQKFNLEAGRNETRASVMSDIANGLKEISMSKNVAIFAGSQLGKNADRQNAKLSDLKESGGIEEASDGVILISEIAEDESYKKLKMHVAKNKYGLVNQFVYVMNRRNCDMEYSFKDTEGLKN